MAIQLHGDRGGGAGHVKRAGKLSESLPDMNVALRQISILVLQVIIRSVVDAHGSFGRRTVCGELDFVRFDGSFGDGLMTIVGESAGEIYQTRKT